eukprot:s438_g1.t1
MQINQGCDDANPWWANLHAAAKTACRWNWHLPTLWPLELSCSRSCKMNRVNNAKCRRSRGNARSQRISATGPFSIDTGQEEDGFLQILKSSIEARVPSVHGAPAGTGGTGNTGEEDSSNQDCRVKSRDGGPYESGAVEAASFESLSDQESTPKQRCLIISPRDPWKVCWDVFIGVLIIYTIITLTWRIGFDQEAREAALALEYSIDILFAVDTILCFRTGFYMEDTFITDWWEIAKRYCMTYFLFDLLSWFPIDLLVQVLTGQNSSGMRSVKLMKFVRLVRLAKLMRLFKLNRFLVLLEEKLHLKPAMIRMVRLIINIVFLAHLLACMWHFIALPACGEETEDIPAVGPCPDADQPKYLPNWISCLAFVSHMALLDGVGEGAAELRASLEALLQELGAKREEARARQHKEEASAEEAARQAEEADRISVQDPSFSFTADLVVKEDTGFELWIGSLEETQKLTLEDALNLCALRDRGIDAVLNCARDDCEAEIACFKPQRCQRRARAHTRNASMGMEASLGAGWLGLRRDQIWSLASFDADWYSDVLELEVLYGALPARDEAGYDMQGHRQEILDFLTECRQHGRKVLVHCIMGVNRAAWATVAFLSGSMGMSLKAAITLAAEKRGCVLSNASFLDQLIFSFATKEDLDDTSGSISR